MTLRDGESPLSRHGAAVSIMRDAQHRVQIIIACGSEAEAIAIIDKAMHDIRATGKTTMVLHGTVDEQATAGKMQ